MNTTKLATIIRACGEIASRAFEPNVPATEYATHARSLAERIERVAPEFFSHLRADLDRFFKNCASLYLDQRIIGASMGAEARYHAVRMGRKITDFDSDIATTRNVASGIWDELFKIRGSMPDPERWSASYFLD